eukprot:scaffold923_cov85-Cylindrotheca_fusiformis.AAC.4
MPIAHNVFLCIIIVAQFCSASLQRDKALRLAWKEQDNQSPTTQTLRVLVKEHFVYQPKQSTANAQDIPFFLSTRLETTVGDNAATKPDEEEKGVNIEGDPVQVLSRYENRAAALAQEYEDEMIRF